MGGCHIYALPVRTPPYPPGSILPVDQPLYMYSLFCKGNRTLDTRILSYFFFNHSAMSLHHSWMQFNLEQRSLPDGLFTKAEVIIAYIVTICMMCKLHQFWCFGLVGRKVVVMFWHRWRWLWVVAVVRWLTLWNFWNALISNVNAAVYSPKKLWFSRMYDCILLILHCFYFRGINTSSQIT